MAAPELVSVRDFSTSRYAQLVENLDTSLSDILARAEGAVQARIGRKLKVQPYIESWYKRSSGPLFVKNRPITTLTAIKRRLRPSYTWETLSLSDVWFDSEAGFIETTFSSYGDLVGFWVQVEYTSGLVTIDGSTPVGLPEDLREAILMQAVLFSFTDFEVYGSGDARAPGILYMNDDIDKLIKPYKHTATVYNNG